VVDCCKNSKLNSQCARHNCDNVYKCLQMGLAPSGKSCRNANVDVSAPISTMLGDKSRTILMPGWMDKYNQSAHLLGTILIAITCRNEVPTEIKGIQLLGCNKYCSSHPSKQLNWHMLRNTLMLMYDDLVL
jgi:hypothetical protein